MKAYTALREVLRKIKASGRATNEDCFEFREAVNDAEFLFGEEIIKQLHEIQEEIWDLQVQGAENRESPSEIKSPEHATDWTVPPLLSVRNYILEGISRGKSKCGCTNGSSGTFGRIRVSVPLIDSWTFFCWNLLS
jgi:hypothetical protein